MSNKKKENVLFVVPKYEAGMETTVPRTSALLSAVLEKGGHNVSIYDMNIDNEENIDTLLKKMGSGVLCVSCTTANIEGGINCAKKAKSYGNIFTIFGGVHPTIAPERLIKLKEIDAIIVGEAEKVITDVVSKRKSGVHEGIPVNIDELPLPSYHLVDAKKYERAYIMTSRGCPNRCTFCSSHTIFGLRLRYMKPTKVVDEMKSLNNAGFDYVWFADDTFTYKRDRVMEICREIKKRKIKMRWYCLTRVDTIDRELLLEMKSAGCTMVNLGIESGDEKIIKKINKNINLDDVVRAFKAAKDAGLRTTAFFMVGFKDQDWESVMKSKKLIEKIKPDITGVNILCPYPDTAIYQEMKEMGIFTGNENWSDFRIRTENEYSSSYITKKVSEYSGMSADDLVKARDLLQETGDRIMRRKKMMSPKIITSYIIRRMKNAIRSA